MKVMVIPVVIGALKTIPQRLSKRTRGVGNRMTSGDRLSYSIDEVFRILRRVLET